MKQIDLGTEPEHNGATPSARKFLLEALYVSNHETKYSIKARHFSGNEVPRITTQQPLSRRDSLKIAQRFIAGNRCAVFASPVGTTEHSSFNGPKGTITVADCFPYDNSLVESMGVPPYGKIDSPHGVFLTPPPATPPQTPAWNWAESPAGSHLCRIPVPAEWSACACRQPSSTSRPGPIL